MVNFTQISPLRLDQAISKELKISRNQALNLIKNALVSVNLKPVLKPSFMLKFNDEICVKFGEIKPKENDFVVNFDVPIIYEDSDLLVINKPPNIVTHGAPSVKEASLVEWLNLRGFMLSNLNGDLRAGIVHRLDKGTSGAMVVAKNNTAHAALSAQLSDKSMGRIYLALTDLALKQNCVIDRPIGRNPANRLKKAIVANGRVAKSAFLNLLSNDEIKGLNLGLSTPKNGLNFSLSTPKQELNLIAAKLFTGRTHQIRVHLASINRHILGDNLYGFKSQKDKINRVMLHAYMLYFIHPKTGEKMEFKAPVWSDFAEILNIIPKEILDEKISPSYINTAFSTTDNWLRL